MAYVSPLSSRCPYHPPVVDAAPVPEIRYTLHTTTATGHPRIPDPYFYCLTLPPPFYFSLFTHSCPCLLPCPFSFNPHGETGPPHHVNQPDLNQQPRRAKRGHKERGRAEGGETPTTNDARRRDAAAAPVPRPFLRAERRDIHTYRVIPAFPTVLLPCTTFVFVTTHPPLVAPLPLSSALLLVPSPAAAATEPPSPHAPVPPSPTLLEVQTYTRK